MSTVNEELQSRVGYFLTWGDVRHLQSLVKQFSPIKHLEVVDLGVGVGTSSLSVLSVRDWNVHITSFDIDADRLAKVADDISRCGCADKWQYVLSDSAIVPKDWPYIIDLLLIDSAHTEEQTRKEVDSWLHRVKPGGIVWFHDYKDSRSENPDNDFPGIRKVVAEEIAKGQLEFLSEGEYGWAGKKL